MTEVKRSEHAAQDVQVDPYWVGMLRATIALEAAGPSGAKIRPRMTSGAKLLQQARDWLIDNLQYRPEGKAAVRGERPLDRLLSEEIRRAERVATKIPPKKKFWPLTIPGAEKAEAQEWCAIIVMAFWERTYGYEPGIHLAGVQERCQLLWQQVGGEVGRKKRTDYTGKAGFRRWETWLSKAKGFPGLVRIVRDFPAG
jgi:hypothetical protein